MPERELILRLVGDEERALHAAHCDTPAAKNAAMGGIASAEQHWIPKILAGALGRTTEEIEARVAKGHRDAEADVRAEGTTLSDVEFLFWRLASEARCREACAEFIAQQAAAAKGMEALFLLMAGLKAAEEAQALVKSVAPRAHVLAMPTPSARRPLRPEDFGCLPSQPRS